MVEWWESSLREAIYLCIPILPVFGTAINLSMAHLSSPVLKLSEAIKVLCM